MTTFYSFDGPVRLYSWDVHTSSGGLSGVTDDRNRAIGHVHGALLILAPGSGARGRVRRVGLSGTGFAKYVHLGDIGEAWRDRASGAVVWRTT